MSGAPRYAKGVRKELKYVNEAKGSGLISFRSAGSHSPIDVVQIDMANKFIQFLQCKPDTIGETERKRLEDELKNLNGVFNVAFDVV